MLNSLIFFLTHICTICKSYCDMHITYITISLLLFHVIGCSGFSEYNGWWNLFSFQIQETTLFGSPRSASSIFFQFLLHLPAYCSSKSLSCPSVYFITAVSCPDFCCKKKKRKAAIRSLLVSCNSPYLEAWKFTSEPNLSLVFSQETAHHKSWEFSISIIHNSSP